MAAFPFRLRISSADANPQPTWSRSRSAWYARERLWVDRFTGALMVRKGSIAAPDIE